MPRIPNELLDSVLYVYESPEAAQEARKVGGSGFFVVVQDAEVRGGYVLYAITNRHVAERAGALRLNTPNGGTDVIDITAGKWVHHPDGDDVSALAIALRRDKYHYLSIPLDEFALERDDDTGPGDDVFFVGRFISHDGRQQNTPVVRFGSIAMMPGEPIKQPGRDFSQESFLIEARSISGFSGSPVIRYIAPGSLRFRDGKWASPQIYPTASIRLLGIDWGHIQLGDEAGVNSGMMAVVPVWKLQELLASKEAVAMRREHVKKINEQPTDTSAVLDFADDRSELERFTDFTERLLRVPKSEVDELRKDDPQA